MSQPCLPVPSRRNKKGKRKWHNNAGGGRRQQQRRKHNNNNNNNNNNVHVENDHDYDNTTNHDDHDDGISTGFGDIQTMDASDYLARVVQQAKKMPDIFVATTTASKGGGKSNVNEKQKKEQLEKESFIPIEGSAASLSYLISPRSCLTPVPSIEYLPKDTTTWIEQTINNFIKLRTYLLDCSKHGVGGKLTKRVIVPAMKDRSGWHLFCVGYDEARGNIDSYYGDDDVDEQAKKYKEEKDDDDDEEGNKVKNGNNDDNKGSGEDNKNGGDYDEEKKLDVSDIPEWEKHLPANGYRPSVSLLLQLDQVMIRRVLGHLGHYINEGWSSTTSSVTSWIYALLVRLDKPIHRDDAAVLFAMLKNYTKARARLQMVVAPSASSLETRRQQQQQQQPQKHHKTDEEENTVAMTNLARINTIIVLIGKYFEQGGGRTSGIMNLKNEMK